MSWRPLTSVVSRFDQVRCRSQMEMNRLVPVAVLVLSIISGVRCTFGLDVSAPTVTASISSAIGSGISSVIKANASIKVEAEADTSGTIDTLITIANNATNPMNRLLGSILAGASSKNVNSQEMFNNISVLITDTSTSINAAATAAKNLQYTTKTHLYNQMNRNLTALNKALKNLSNGVSIVQSQVEKAASAEYAPTISNITVYLNKTVVANLTSPLKSIRNYLSGVASTISIIAAERSQAINYQSQLNETMSTAVRNIASAAVNFNRTLLDVQQRISQQQASTFKAINQTYASIVLRADSYGGDIRNLTQFLADMVTANASFTQFVDLSTNYSMEQVARALRERTAYVTGTLVSVINNVTSQSVTNSSANTPTCTQKTVQQLQQNPVSMGRLVSCLQSETNSFRSTTQFVQVQMESVKSAAASIAVQLSRICQRDIGSCTASFFAALPDHSQRVQNKISVAAGGVSNDEHIVTGRIVDCLTGASEDIVMNAENILTKFTKCLAVVRAVSVT